MVTISQGERFACRIQGDDLPTAYRYQCFLLNKAEGKTFAENVAARTPSTAAGTPAITAEWSANTTRTMPLGVLALDIKAITDGGGVQSIYFVERFAVVRSSCVTVGK